MSGRHTPPDGSSTSRPGESAPLWLLALLLVVGAMLNLTALVAHSLSVLVAGGACHGIFMVLLGHQPQRTGDGLERTTVACPPDVKQPAPDSQSRATLEEAARDCE